jgi:hypothetical protein
METMHTSIPQALVEAYRAAHYKIDDGAEKFTLRVDEHSSALQDLYRRTGESSALFITAFNPFGRMQNEKENLADQQALRTDLLLSRGEYLLTGVGEDPTGEWPGEPSWLTLGIDIETSKCLGAQYRQNAVLWAGSDAIPRLVLLR